MKKLILIFLIIYSTGSFACHRAYQYRLFPIAASEHQIIFLEIEMVREATDKNLWKGTANIINFLNDSIIIINSLDSVSFSSKNYIEDLTNVFLKAEKLIDTNEYKIINVENIRLCRHQSKCYGFELNRLTKENLQINSLGNVNNIELPKTKISADELMFAGGFGEPFNINSVREFEFQGKKAFIVNVGTGEKESSDFNHLVKDQMQFENTPLFPELTLYHGFCFDMIVFPE